MEKAVLKTLAYADIFDYPLNVWEIHKWLIGKKISLRQMEKALERLVQNLNIKNQKGFYFLKGRNKIVRRRLLKEKHSGKLLIKARLMGQVFKLIPFIKLVGVSGSLALDNAKTGDDIDLLIITSKNRLWFSRLLLLLMLTLTGKRRTKSDSKKSSGGKFCVNLILEESNLEQRYKDLYIAHEVLQMKVLWDREGVYHRFLEANEWAFKFMPNWLASTGSVSSIKYQVLNKKPKSTKMESNIVDILEKLARNYQLKVMGKPKGDERVEDAALYLHPVDYRPKVLKEYKEKIKFLSTP